jgi:hypothetical protein
MAGGILVVGGCIGLGALLGRRPELAKFAVVLIGLIVLLGLGSRVLIPLLVLAVFVTRFRIAIGGYHFLPEHVVAIALIGALVLEGRTRAMWEAATDRTALALGAFIVWEAVVSLVQAPNPSESMAIVGWLALDWLMLIAVVARLRDSARLEWLAVGSNTVLAAVAVGLGIAAAVSSSTLGTQPGYANGADAVYALSFEANILASTVAVWAFIALSSPHERVRRIARFCVPLALAAIAFSLTRAVVLGFGLGLLVWGLVSGQRAARRAAKLTAAAAFVVVVVSLAAPSVASPLQARFTDLLELKSGSGHQRVDAAKTAISDLGVSNVFAGLGVDSYGQRHEDPTRPGRHIPGYLGILPLQIVYEGGIVAVILLGVALASLRPLARPGRGRALGVLAIYLSAATATSPFWFGWTWLLIALAMITRPGEPKAAEGTRGSAVAPLEQSAV